MALDVSRFDALLGSDPLEALEMAKNAVRKLTGEKSCARAQALDSVATAYRVIGDYAKAERSYLEAESTCRCSRCHPGRLRRMTYLRAMQGEHAEAIASGQRALEEGSGFVKALRGRVEAITRSHDDLLDKSADRWEKRSGFANRRAMR